MDALAVALVPAQCARTATDCEHCRMRLRSICSALDRDELADLEAIAQPVHFAAKETLFVEGEEAQAAYTLTRGTARLYRVFDDGRRQILGFMLPGDFLGLDLASHRAFSADAVDEVSACRLSRTGFAALTARKPHLLKRLHAATTRELNLAQDQTMALGRRSAEEKLAWFLVHLRQRSAPPSALVALAMSRLDIADFLGLTIETVSRTLTRLARQKIVALVPEGVRLLDVARIEGLAAT